MPEPWQKRIRDCLRSRCLCDPFHNYSCRQQFHRNFDLGVSQAEHPEIFAGVPSEGEGIRLVKKSLAYLVKTGHIWLIPGLIAQSGFKYAGYFLGKRYRKLPEKMILFCTMNREYWKNRKKNRAFDAVTFS